MVRFLIVFKNSSCLTINADEFDTTEPCGNSILLKRGDFIAYCINGLEILYIKTMYFKEENKNEEDDIQLTKS